MTIKYAIFLASFDYSSFYFFLSSVFNIYEWKLGLVHYILRIVCLEIDFGLLNALSRIGPHWKYGSKREFENGTVPIQADETVGH